MRPFLQSLFLSAVVTLAPALAAPGPTAPPPGRVGRVSFTDGKVSARPVPEAQWSDAVIDAPVAAGTALRTAADARAEIEIGADTLDLAGNTQVEIVRLDDRVAEIALSAGRVEVARRGRGGASVVEIDFPRGGLWLSRPGRYDIDAGDATGARQIAVFDGAAHFAGNGADIRLNAGEALDPASATTGKAAADDFADWCRARDWDEASLAAPYYVSPEMTGSAELDAAGRWERSLEYGAVWFPKDLPTDWIPYSAGQWRWVAPWGWTWFADQAWGFAPFHYGRWASIGGRWAWVPGRFVAHPVYMPAAVAFLGTAGIGLSYAEGSGPAVAWFPLGPGEAYWPRDTADLDYIRALNRGDVADAATIRLSKDGKPPVEIVGQSFANRLFASAVPRTVFTAGQETAPWLLDLPKERLQNAPVLTAAPVGAPAPPAPPHVAAAVPAPKLAHPTKPVHAAAVHTRHEQAAARSRGAHLRAPGYAAAPRLRHLVALHAAHPRPVMHKKESKR